MHDRGIIHGNLKGVRANPTATSLRPSLFDPKASILIDKNGHARLAGFNLHTIASDQLTPTTLGGTTRWMSPELFAPDTFGLKESCSTKESDCYALGMVIYEVLSGQAPFSPQSNTVVILAIMRGERPRRPQGEEGTLFTDGIWEVLERCWKPPPRERISAKDILLGISGNPHPLRSFSIADMETDGDDWSTITASDSSMFSPFRPRPIFNHSYAMTGRPVPHGGNEPLVPPHGRPPCTPSPTPQTSRPGEGRIGGKLMRGARRVCQLFSST